MRQQNQSTGGVTYFNYGLLRQKIRLPITSVIALNVKLITHPSYRYVNIITIASYHRFILNYMITAKWIESPFSRTDRH